MKVSNELLARLYRKPCRYDDVSYFKTDQGIKNLLPEDAARLEGADPDHAQRDLYNAIENGNFPSWTMYLQVMTYEEAEKWQFNPFDLTKVR